MLQHHSSSRGAPELLGEQGNSRAGNTGLRLAMLLPTITRKKKYPSLKPGLKSLCLKTSGNRPSISTEKVVKRQQSPHVQMKGF